MFIAVGEGRYINNNQSYFKPLNEGQLQLTMYGLEKGKPISVYELTT